MLRILNNLVAALVKAWGWYCPNDEATPRRLQTQLKVIPLEARRVLNADGFTSEILSLGESEFAMPAQEALNETHTEHQASDAVAKFTNSKHQEADKLAPTNEIVFLDSSIENYHLLETSLSENFNLVLLKSHEDATQTIIHSLDRKHGLDAIHVLTHGAPGSISLGSHQLTSETLGQHAELLTSLRDTLSDSGDIFIYGCDVAQGEIGEAFTSALANATGADVSASIDKTGSTTLGGNWNLEYSHGEIGETLLADNLNVIDFKQLLDMESPTATVELEADFLSSTNNSTTLTVTFSEAPIGFSEDDLILSNGRISQGSYDDSNLTYTALFTADSNVDNTGGVELIGGSYEDAAGNSGGGSVDTADIDTKNPTSEITFNGVLLNSVNNTTTVTIEFSEDPVGFVEEDLIVSNGTLSDFSGQDTIWTAKFQANSNTTGVGTVQLPDSSYTDHIDFQNPGVGSVGNIAIDTLNPTANVALDAEDLSDGSNSTTLTITFSEVPVGFDPNSDLSVTGGTLGTGSFNDAELVWTATYTATDGIDVTGSVSLASASYTDAAGNDGFGDSDTVAIDTLNPTANVALDAEDLSDGSNSTTLTITFSEVPVGFDPNSDLSVTGGTLGTGSFNDAELVWTATYTATDGIDVTGSVSLASASYTDAAGNDGFGDSDTVAIDTLNPTANVALDAEDLSDGSNSTTLTITFSEVPVGFDPNSDLSVTGGTLGTGSFNDAELVWTATYTATDGIDVTGSVSLASASYTDAAGNDGFGDSDTVAIDTLNPTANVALDAEDLSDGSNSTTLTITFSEVPVGFDPNSDLSVTGGTLGTGSFNDAELVWTATYTATDGIDVTGSVSLASASYTDAAGNDGFGDSDTVAIDTLNPTANVALDAEDLSDGSNSTTLTITFSEVPVGFDPNSDLSVTGGTLGTGSFNDAELVWTATYTATDGIDVTGSVSLASASYTDAAGNDGFGDSDTVAIDTLNPTANVALDAEDLSDGSNSTTLTITFSEVPVGFDPNSDLSVTGGTLGTGSFNDAELVWTATYTATDGIDVTGSVSLASASYTDAAGNDGFGDSDTVAIDTLNPTANVALDAEDLSDGSNSTTLTITFSEVPVGFDPNSDLSVTGGTLGTGSFNDAELVWTATYTATDGIDVTGSVSLASASYTDAAGNDGFGDSDTVAIDTLNPTANVALDAEDLSDGSNSTTLTITFSEVPVGFDPNSDLSVTGGTLGTGSFNDAELVWTATYTATDGIDVTGSVSLASASYTDAAGNDGFGDSDTVAIDTLNPTANVALDAEDLSDGSNSTTLTITFSEVPVGFDPNSDLSVTGGTLGTGSFNDAELVWTATYTATDGIDVTGSVSLASASYTDAAGNDGFGDSDTVAIDTLNPTANVALDAEDLSDGSNSTTLTITFSEVPVGFDPNSDLSVTGGTLGTGSFNDAELVWTATYTATDGIDVTGSVSLASASYTDAAGNDGFGDSDTVAIDTLNPTANVALDAEDLSDGSNSTTLTITFSEVPVGFDPNSDLSVTGGTLGTGSFNDAELVWTATYTATDGIDVTGSVSLASASYTDAAGNDGFGDSDTVAIDTLNPTANVALDAEDLSDGSNSTTLTITFSEVPVGFDPNSDLSVTGGTLGTGSFNDAELVWTATYTATDGIDVTGSVSLASASYTDAAGNDGFGDSDTVAIDTLNPTANVALDAEDLSDGSNSTTLTITFSEVPVGFDPNSDLSVTGGTLGTGSFNDAELVWTATYTATDGIDVTGSVSLASASYTDAAGNDGFGDSDTVAIDTLNPTANVALDAEDLSDGSNSTTLTITFSEVPVGFDPNSDLSVTGGTLGTGSFNDAELVWTATYTATDGIDVTGSVSLASASYTDAAGNDGFGDSDTVAIDTLNPTANVALDAEDLSDGSNSTTLTITFSEVPVGFDPNSDLSVTGGTLGTGSFNDAELVWTATYTATDGIDVTGSVSLASASYTDAAGNDGFGDSDTVAIDTLNPTANVALDAEDLSDGSNSTTLTITFSEVPVGFDPNSDLSVTGGTLGTGSFNDAELVWTATYTATDGIDVTGSVSLASASYTDAAGNDGFGDSDTVAIDTLNPTANVALDAEDLSDGSNSTTLTITFSEVPVGFDPNSDLSVTGGTLGTGSFNDAELVWTATYTATDGIDVTGSVSLASASYTDAAGNDGFGDSDTVAIDTLNPVVTSVVRADSNYTNATAVSYIVTFSEDVTGVDVNGSDFSLVTSIADASILSVAGSHATYTVMVNTGNSGGSIGLALAATPTIQDVAGNDLIERNIAGSNEAYTVASTEVLLNDGNVTVTDIRDATADDITLSVAGSDLIISSASDSIAAGVGVTRVNASSVSVALADISGSNGVTVLSGDLDDTVTVEGLGRRLEIVGGTGTDVVQFQNVALGTNGGDLLIDAEGLTQDADASIDANNVTLGSLGSNFVLNAAMTTTGDLLVNTSGDLLQTQSGELLVGGVTTLNANNVVLDNSANDFQAAVHAYGSRLIFVDANDITFGDIDAEGAFFASALSSNVELGGLVSSSTANITAGGSITGTGLLSAATLTLDAQSGIGLIGTETTQAIQLATQNLTAETNTGNIALQNRSDNNVTVNTLTTNNGSISLIQDSQTAENVARLTTQTVSAAADVNQAANVNLTNQAGDIALEGTISSKNLTVDASGSVTDGNSGDLAISEGASFAGNAITLGNDAGNTVNFGTLTFNSNGDVEIREDSDMSLTGSSTAMSLTGSSTPASATLVSTGSITDTSESIITINNLLDLDAQSISLVNSTLNAGSIVFNSNGNVEIREGSDMSLTGNNTAASATLISTGHIELGGSVSSGSLNVTAGGSVTDGNSGDLDISGGASFAGNAITLGNDAGNTVNFGTLTYNSNGDVEIREDSDMSLTGSSTAMSLTGSSTAASATLVSTGSITDTSESIITINNLLDLDAQSISLVNSTLNAGSIVFNSNGDVEIREGSDMSLTGNSTAASATLVSTGHIELGGSISSGSLNVTAVGSVTDGNTGDLDISGGASFAGTSITLGDSQDNATHFGTLTFNSNGSVQITEESAMSLTGSSTAASATLVSTGSITDTSESIITINNLLDLDAQSISLVNSTLNAGSIVFNSNGDVEIREDSAMNVTGNSQAGSSLHLSSVDDIQIAAAVTAGSLINIDAGVDTTGGFIMTSAGSLSTTASNSTITVDTGSAGGNVTLESGSQIRTQSDGNDSVTINSSAGSITGTGLLSAATLTLDAQSGIGLIGTETTQAIQLATQNLTAETNTGNIALQNRSDSDVTVNTLTTNAGSISYLQETSSGQNTGGAHLTTQTVSAAVDVNLTNQAGDIALEGTVSSTNLTVEASGGSVTDGESGDLDISGGATFAGNAITLGNDAGNTVNFGTLTFNSAGDVEIREDSAMNVTGNSQAGSSLHLSSVDDIQIAAAVTAGSLINIDAGVDTTGGFIMTSAGSLSTTASNSTITVDTGSAGGNVTLESGSQIRTQSDGNDSVTINSSAGSITGTGLLSAATLTLDAQSGIGLIGTETTQAIQLATQNLTAETNTGNIALQNRSDSDVTVNTLTTNAGSISYLQETSSGQNTGGAHLTTQTVSAAVDVNLTNQAGDIALEGTVSSTNLTVEASGGSVTDGESGDLDISGGATFAGNAITLGNDAGNTVNFGTLTFNSAGDVEIREDSAMNVTGNSQAGSSLHLSSVDDIQIAAAVTAGSLIDIDAGVDTTGGFIMTSAGSLTTTASNSTITVDTGSAGGNVTLESGSQIRTQSDGNDSVTINSSAGSITGTGLLSAATLTLDAQSGIGLIGTETTQAIQLATQNLTAETNTGNIALQNRSDSDVTVQKLTTNAGSISLIQDSQTAENVAHLTTQTVSAAADINLTNQAGDIALEGTVSSTNLTVEASGGSVTDGESGDLDISGGATFAGNAITLGNDAGNTVNFGTLTFNSTGDVEIREDSAMNVTGNSQAGSSLHLSSVDDIQIAAAVTAGSLINIDAGVDTTGGFIMTSAGSLSTTASNSTITVDTGSAGGNVTLESGSQIRTQSGKLTADFFNHPGLEAHEEPENQLLTETSKEATILVEMAKGADVLARVDWQDHINSIEYKKLPEATDNNQTTDENHKVVHGFRHEYSKPKTQNDEVQIFASIHAFAPVSADGAGTITIHAEGVDVLEDSRFHAETSITVLDAVADALVMMPEVRAMDLRTIVAPLVTEPTIFIQRSAMIVSREYTTLATPNVPSTAKPHFYFIKFGAYQPGEKSEDSFSENFELKDEEGEVFDMGLLPKLFSRLPDNYYEIFRKDGDSEQLVTRFIIKDGNPIIVPPDYPRIEEQNPKPDLQKQEPDDSKQPKMNDSAERLRAKVLQQAKTLLPKTSSKAQPAKGLGASSSSDKTTPSVIEHLGKTPVISIAGSLIASSPFRLRQPDRPKVESAD